MYVESVRIQPQVRTLPPFRGITVDVISVPQDVRYVVVFWLSERGEEGQKGVRSSTLSPFRGKTVYMYVESVRIQPQVRTVPPFRGITVDVVSVPQDMRYVVDSKLIVKEGRRVKGG